MTTHIGIGPNHLPPTVDPIAPPPEAPPTPVTNTQARPAPDARPIAAASALLKDAAKKFERHLASIDPAPYTPSGLKGQISAFAESPAMRQVDEAVEIATQREADAEAHVAEIVAGLSPKGDVAEELRANRAWDRAARQLDAVPDNRVAETARKLIDAADPTELAVLLQELPSLLASKNQASDWIEQVVGEKVPALAAAQRKLKLARQAKQLVDFDSKRLRERVTNTPAPRAYSPVAFLDVTKYDPDK